MDSSSTETGRELSYTSNGAIVYNRAAPFLTLGDIFLLASGMQLIKVPFLSNQCLIIRSGVRESDVGVRESRTIAR